MKIITRKRLSKRVINKYKFYNETSITLTGQKIGLFNFKKTRSDISTNYFGYTTDSDKLKLKKSINIDGEPVYLYKSHKGLLFILFVLIILAALCAIAMYKPNYTQKPTFDIVGEDKVEQTKGNADYGNIVYQGLPDAFTIDVNTQILSIANDTANEGKFYTGVRIKEGEEIIYEMGSSLLEPGKFVNINLCDLLTSGEHVITIEQYGYILRDKVTKVTSETSQKVNVTVIKEEI